MQSKRYYVAATLCFAIFSAGANAQAVLQADKATLQPQIGRDDSGFNSCGVRAVVLLDRGNFIEGHDFSMNIRADMFYGMLKSGKVMNTKAEVQSGKVSLQAIQPAPVKFWIAKESEGKAVIPTVVQKADTPGYILELADLTSTYLAIIHTIQGERMQFATRYKAEPLDTVVTFAATMPESESKPLMNCLNEVIERLKKAADQQSQ